MKSVYEPQTQIQQELLHWTIIFIVSKLLRNFTMTIKFPSCSTQMYAALTLAEQQHTCYCPLRRCLFFFGLRYSHIYLDHTHIHELCIYI